MVSNSFVFKEFQNVKGYDLKFLFSGTHRAVQEIERENEIQEAKKSLLQATAKYQAKPPAEAGGG